MKYEIHNLQLIESIAEQQVFEQVAQQRIRQLGQLLKRYPQSLKLDILLKKEGGECVVATTLALHSRVLMSREKGPHAPMIVHHALTRLLQRVKEQVQAERKEYFYKRRERLSYRSHSGKDDLQVISQENDAEHFIVYLQKLLPELRRYISVTAFKIRVLKPLMKQNKVRIYDVIQRIFEHLFNRFPELNGHGDKIYLWAIAEADQALQRLARKYEYRFLKEIDFSENGIRAEWERVTFNAEGLLYDHEARSEENFFNPPHYNITEILQDAGAAAHTIDKAEEGVYDEQLKQWFYELDLQHTAVFHLYYQMRLTTQEIARIKQKSEAEIRNMLNDLRSSLLGYLQSDG